MPRKLRKHKLLTFKHQQKMLSTLENVQNNSGLTLPLTHEVVKEKVDKPPIIPITKVDETVVHNFRIDLKKSLLLISGIIALEIFFYFASMSKDLTKLLK